MIPQAAIRHLTPDEVEAVADLNAGTFSAKQIAQRLGITPQGVYAIRRRLELKIGFRFERAKDAPGPKPKPLTSKLTPAA